MTRDHNIWTWNMIYAKLLLKIVLIHMYGFVCILYSVVMKIYSISYLNYNKQLNLKGIEVKVQQSIIIAYLF